ncbi:F0F1 ATP synthase subunit gamma [Synechococcus sp. PCC 7336]|uniref:F0F1 ATP synthase subunit gamma n=1 Tax=Synechococcus sp. PCC 7336 TaxID=195250 RepID=UPI00034DAC5D|nr:F0F1 ATP synthase subunit gamma [Synechococcus sp. PCC 7336]
MSNLKAIRDRIKSVKNTRKITEAMRLVAAAKVRRAQEQVNASRPFADRLAQVFFRLQTRLEMEDVELPLLEQRPVKKVGLLVVSGDRGLCGAYNINVLKKTEQRAAELADEGIECEYFLVGRKAVQYFKRRGVTPAKTFIGLEQIPIASEAGDIADSLMAAFVAGKIDRVELIYTRFVSLISSRPVLQTLLPMSVEVLQNQQDEVFRMLVRQGKFTVERDIVDVDLSPAPQDTIFEQAPTQILDALLPLYTESQLLRALQESAASELACRMTAMNNASDNAKELISTLNLSYNKARQASITQEILEVVGGANM